MAQTKIKKRSPIKPMEQNINATPIVNHTGKKTIAIHPHVK